MPVGNNVIKGSFSIPATGERLLFMFNPPSVRDRQGISYPDQVVPGMSHPVTQYAGGGPRLITFELYLDGDRGNVGRDQSGRLQNHATPAETESSRRFRSNLSEPGAPSKSIQSELEFYMSLRHPAETLGNGLSDIHPHLILFSFGPLYRGVPCVVQQADPDVIYWSLNLEPIRANIEIVLKQVTTQSIGRSEVFSRVVGGGSGTGARTQ